MTPDVYLAIKYRDDHANPSVVEAIVRALARHDLTTYCVAADLERWGQHQLPPGELMRVALAMIDSARAFAGKLREAGNRHADLYVRAGMPHGFYFFPGLFQQEDEAFAEVGRFITRHLLSVS